MVILKLLFYTTEEFFSEKTSNIPQIFWIYIMPVAAGAMVVRMLFYTEIAWLFSIVTAFFCGFLAEGDFLFSIYYFLF